MKLLIIFTIATIGFLALAGFYPTEAEYHHCMVTSTDKSVCLTIK